MKDENVKLLILQNAELTKRGNGGGWNPAMERPGDEGRVQKISADPESF